MFAGKGWTPAVTAGLVSNKMMTSVQRDIVDLFVTNPKFLKDAAFWFDKTAKSSPVLSNHIDRIIRKQVAAATKPSKEQLSQPETDADVEARAVLAETVLQEASLAADIVMMKTVPYDTDNPAMSLSWKTVRLLTMVH